MPNLERRDDGSSGPPRDGRALGSPKPPMAPRGGRQPGETKGREELPQQNRQRCLVAKLDDLTFGNDEHESRPGEMNRLAAGRPPARVIGDPNKDRVTRTTATNDDPLSIDFLDQGRRRGMHHPLRSTASGGQ